MSDLKVKIDLVFTSVHGDRPSTRQMVEMVLEKNIEEDWAPVIEYLLELPKNEIRVYRRVTHQYPDGRCAYNTYAMVSEQTAVFLRLSWPDFDFRFEP